MTDMSRQCVSIGDVAYVTLTGGKVATIDLEDVPDVMRHHWWLDQEGRTYYARTRIGGVRVRMHRFLLNPPRDIEIDHVNHDGLDNRRANIRLCTKRENAMNMMKREKGSSQYKGVMWVNDRGSWRAQIKVNGKCIFLGNFNVEKDAARAYNVAAKQYFREFALLNEGVGDEVPRKQEGDLF